MKQAAALLLLLSLLTLTAWTFEDCVEVDFDHPHCDQYVTTTTEAPSTTTTPPVSTSTSGASTTTSTYSESPTTTVTSSTPIPTTATTVQECPAGTIHQPPLCVPTTVPFFDTTTPDTTSVINSPAELPRTGVADLPLLTLSLVGLSVLGFTALKYGRREE